jgi:hypothetical protein
MGTSLFSLLKLCLIVSVCTSGVLGFAEWMMKDFCHLEIVEGAVIMNAEAEVSSERKLTILRKTGSIHYVELTEQDGYNPGETLHVMLTNTEGQFVLDVVSKNAEFVHGGCPEAQRVNINNAAIIMPHGRFEGEDVRIQAAWAMGHHKVKITPTVVIRPNKTQMAPSEPPRASKETKLRKETIPIADVADDMEQDSKQNAVNFAMMTLSAKPWYIGGGLLFLLVVYVLFRLQNRGGRRLRGTKMSYD